MRPPGMCLHHVYHIAIIAGIISVLFSAISSCAAAADNWHDNARSTQCSKILIVAPISSASHIYIYGAFARGLVDRCHSVHLLASYESKSHRHPNITQVSTPTFKRLSDEFFWFKLNELPPYSTFEGTAYLAWIMNQAPRACQELLGDEEYLKYLNLPDDHFDLVLVSPHIIDDCALAFAHKARRGNKPWGHLFSSIAAPWVSHAFGNPAFGNFKPAFTSPWTHPMPFWQRVISVLVQIMGNVQRHSVSYAKVRQVLQESWDPTIPDLEELERTSVISFANEDLRLFVYQEPRVADMIPIGGIHVGPAKPLPKDLDEWAKSAKNGFVLFALGSAVKSKDFPIDDRDKFVNAFKSFPDVKFLWKWDNGSIPGLSANVKLEDWLPQSDVLGHKNIRGFITHGGMLSTQEATYHGVPVVGIPIGADQHSNMGRVANVDQAGVTLEWSSLTTEKIVDAIKVILEDKTIINSVKRRSRLFKDQPETPLERGVFWTEYVLRNGYDTGLRSLTRDVNWFHLYAIDVWLFLISVFTVFVMTVALFARFVFKAVKSLISKQENQNSNRNKSNSAGKFTRATKRKAN